MKKNYIFYDENVFGPGYYIYDFENKNFIKLGFNWKDNDEIEYFVFFGQNNPSSNIIFNTYEGEDFYYYLKSVYDLINNDKIGNNELNFSVIQSDSGFDLMINKTIQKKYVYHYFDSSFNPLISQLYNQLDKINCSYKEKIIGPKIP